MPNYEYISINFQSYEQIASHETNEEFLNVLQAKAPEFDHSFVQHMVNAMVMSWYKYGNIGPRAGSRAYMYIEREQNAFKKDHNLEHMVNVANYAMIRYMFPSGDNPEDLYDIALEALDRYIHPHAGEFYKGTDSDKSVHNTSYKQTKEWLRQDIDDSFGGAKWFNTNEPPHYTYYD